MENIILDGKVMVTFTTENTSYDKMLKKILSSFMETDRNRFKNKCIAEGLIKNSEPVKINYKNLEENIEEFLNDEVRCIIIPKLISEIKKEE